MADDLFNLERPDSAAFSRTADQDETREGGTATPSVAEAFYSNGVLTGSFSKVAAIQSDANFLQRQPDAGLFTNQGNNTRDDADNDKDGDGEDDDLTKYRAGIERIEEQQEIDRQLWAQTQSTFAGVTMTGKQWSDLGTELSGDTELRRSMIDKFSKEGRTKEDAEGFADKIARLMKIQGKRDADRTDAERQELAETQSDPSVKAAIEAVQTKSGELAHTKSVPADSIAKAETATSTFSRADEFSSFQSAPDLSRDYSHAIVATKPPDNRPLPAIERAPSPQLQATGFDV